MERITSRKAGKATTIFLKSEDLPGRSCFSRVEVELAVVLAK